MQLARDFMREQDSRGWDWDLEAAYPDPIDPECRGRKIATRWVVCVQYKKNGSLLDGPAVISVNIANGSAAFMESP